MAADPSTWRLRRAVKGALAAMPVAPAATGATLLIHHRIGGGTSDERDVPIAAFRQQLDVLVRHRVVPLDTALDALDSGDDTPMVVVTFDDGFADVHDVAWPMLRDHGLPFTLYLSTAYVGGEMHWDGSTASAPGPALTWSQLEELAADPLVTIANHTHTHARPERLTAEELDTCSRLIEERLGVVPRHFAFTWGVPVESAAPMLRARFRSSATGILGRNHPGTDPHLLRRVPVRGSDPLPFFRAKLAGGLGPERAYARLVALAKRGGATG